MKTFRTLELAIQFSDRALDLKISGHLRDQLIRASTSIALNLSEGNAKFPPKEKKRFYQTAYASQKECQTILRLAHNQDQEIEKLIDHLGASLYKLLRSEIKELKSDSDGLIGVCTVFWILFSTRNTVNSILGTDYWEWRAVIEEFRTACLEYAG